MKKVLSCIFIFIVIFAVAAVGGYFFVRHKLAELSQPSDLEDKSQEVVFEVVSGSTCRSVAEELEKQKIIRSADVFTYIARRDNLGSAIKTGFFRIKPSMTPEEILNVFVNGEQATRKLTFPEGLTLKECAQIAAKAGICTYDDFMKITRHDGRKYGAIFPADMEGYFLPDTYILPWKCGAEELVAIAAARFEELAVPYHDGKSPLSLKDTVILASLVEREAQVPSERPIIAGVYINRLNDGMKLECDATVQFALGKQKEYLLYKDLEIDSPYNTYKITGLPAGPICSPGLESIKAACHPAKSPYYYYVRNDVKGDGSHVFGRNFNEHQRNIRRYQR
ncbi:endolytic transglycosylase MltG [bacterium]|nr:endolytic transglycosylase MltG [bacterium]